VAGPKHTRTNERADPVAGFLDTPMGLSRLEAWALTSVRRWGTNGLILRASAASVAASVVITATLLALVFGVTEDSFVPGVVLGAIVPALVAPPVITVIARLVARLDETGRRLLDAAITDPLTGVYNRRGFFDGFDPTEAADGPLAAAMVDIDDFKRLNDQLGHAQGDLVLRHVAGWLDAHAEDRGTVARLGGDEFVLVAPADVVMRLRAYETLTAASIAYSITVGSAPIGAAGLHEALADADAALYRNKAARRNRRPH
jgi:diguanylate cyclase (GGDEF)-like protein